ncbi:MAG: HAD family hydrolase [Promethearchaeota archaeon]|nr:MAG: HAD family hydrolase [Candidatus Lokiarchaeota archaeon]
MTQPKAIFYDMDGTLVHFIIDYIKARRCAIQEIEKQGVKNASEMFSVEKPWTTTIKQAKKYMKDVLGFSSEKISAIQSRINKRIVEIEREAASRAIKVDNIEKVLEFGKTHNVKQVIITYNTHDVAVLTLKTVGLLHFFDAIYGRDDISNPKPNKEHLEVAAQRFNFSPKCAILIGDMHSDILAAHNFGCEAIGIRTDFEINAIDDADYIVEQKDAPDKIIEIIRSKFEIL